MILYKSVHQKIELNIHYLVRNQVHKNIQLFLGRQIEMEIRPEITFNMVHQIFDQSKEQLND